MTAAKQLREAVLGLLAGRRNLVMFGWIQGRFGSRDGGFCAVGAIPETVECIKPGLEILRIAVTGDAGESVATWNDANGRKLRHVLAAYDEAIEIAESLALGERAIGEVEP